MPLIWGSLTVFLSQGSQAMQNAYKVPVEGPQHVRAGFLTSPSLQRDRILEGAILLLSDASVISIPDLYEVQMSRGL